MTHRAGHNLTKDMDRTEGLGRAPAAHVPRTHLIVSSDSTGRGRAGLQARASPDLALCGGRL